MAKVVIGAALAFSVMFAVGVTKLRSPGRGSGSIATSAPPETPARLWSVPEFSFVDQNGNMVAKRSLSGRVWVADFIFTRCTTACPVITAKMSLLRREMQNTDVTFVSLSVDPAFDTPAVLKEYAARWDGDARWLLLCTRQPELGDFARSMKVAVEPTLDEENPILHSTQFFLVDREGFVRGMYDSLDDQALKQLTVDAKEVSEEGAPLRARLAAPRDERERSAQDQSERGSKLFQSLGCAACHSNAKIAPPLSGALGSSVELRGGGRKVVDDAYLRASILDPARDVVVGYSPLMPSYQGHLDEEQLADLIAYLRTRTTGTEVAITQTAIHAAQAIDPVCKMKVAADDATSHASYDGQTYYFCSETCRDRFLKNPQKYVPR